MYLHNMYVNNDGKKYFLTLNWNSEMDKQLNFLVNTHIKAFNITMYIFSIITHQNL